jgi:hypothetical protein
MKSSRPKQGDRLAHKPISLNTEVRDTHRPSSRDRQVRRSLPDVPSQASFLSSGRCWINDTLSEIRPKFDKSYLKDESSYEASEGVRFGWWRLHCDDRLKLLRCRGAQRHLIRMTSLAENDVKYSRTLSKWSEASQFIEVEPELSQCLAIARSKRKGAPNNGTTTCGTPRNGSSRSA